MADETTKNNQGIKEASPVEEAKSGVRGGRGNVGRGFGGGRRREGSGGRHEREKEEFQQEIIDLARVTRVMAGGKRMRFRACIVIGDRAGRVGLGLAKGQDVTVAINKAVAQAKKHVLQLKFVNETIPYMVAEKFKAAKIILKPAAKGRGIIAGGAVRVVLEMAGVPNVVAKNMGSNNKMNNAKATMKAFERLSAVKKMDSGKTEK